MATSLGLRTVDPLDVRIFNIDWTGWLNNIGSTLSLSSWMAPNGLIVYQTSFTALKTSIKLGGWVSGGNYTIYNTIQTATGETKRVEFDIECP